MNPARFCRVRYLGKRITALKVAERAPADHEAVFFSASITLENIASSEEVRYRIAGPDETDAELGWAGSASTRPWCGWC